MKKLTKTQAQELIKEVFESRDKDLDDSDNPWYRFEDFKRIINQCTEKEFPKIRCAFGVHCELTFKMPDCNTVGIDYNADDIEFSIEEFKEFANGVNKIVEYLNEEAE